MQLQGPTEPWLYVLTQIMHTYSGDSLAIITVPNCHELFKRKQYIAAQEKLHEYGHVADEKGEQVGRLETRRM